MPVRDAARTLPAALDSVLAQSESAWELIAVDDHSGDDSPEILAAYARRDRRVRVIAAPRDGIVAALNAGLAAARGALIARMDADDVCHPDRLRQQRARLEARPHVGLVGCCVEFGGDPVRAAGYARHVEWTNGLLTHEQIAIARFVESPFAHPSVMFRRTVLTRYGGYAEGDFPEDYELWLRWLDAGVRMEKLADRLLVWNDHPERLSRRDARYADEAFYRLKARYLAPWLARNNRHHPRVVVWGAGRLARRRIRYLEAEGIVVSGYIDIDPAKIGRPIAGRPVNDAAALPAPGTAFIVSYVSSAGAREQIEARLTCLGWRAGAHYVLAG
jgi:glycosyltransferase involved in cell wall biosynthesis